MTREEAISEARRSTIDDCGWFHDDDTITSEQNSIALVNKIYDDFESRTCNNCKFKNCDIKIALIKSDSMNPDYFCCIDWD